LCDTAPEPYPHLVPDSPPDHQAEPVDDSPDAIYPGAPELVFDDEYRSSRWGELLRSLADEYGCDLLEVGPGRYMIRPGATAEELDRDRPIRP